MLTYLFTTFSVYLWDSFICYEKYILSYFIIDILTPEQKFLLQQHQILLQMKREIASHDYILPDLHIFQNLPATTIKHFIRIDYLAL